MLARRGVDVIAIDIYEGMPEVGLFFPETKIEDGVEFIARNGGCSDRALFMCWPSGYAPAHKRFSCSELTSMRSCVAKFERMKCRGHWEVVGSTPVKSDFFVLFQ